MLENRRWLIIPTTIVNEINFNQVKESNVYSLRYSLDGTKTFVKYDITIVEEDYERKYINAETNEEQTEIVSAGIYGRPAIFEQGISEHTHEEILEILNGPEWTEQIDR
jgi:hypothetical protein